MEHGVLDERAHVAARGVIAAHRVHHHRAVVGQRAGVVGDQQRAALRGDVLEAGRLDAEPLRVQELEQPLPARGRARIAAEIVDDVGAAPHRERAPAPPHAPRAAGGGGDRSGTPGVRCCSTRRSSSRSSAAPSAAVEAHRGRAGELLGDHGLLAEVDVVAEEAEVAIGPRGGVGHARIGLAVPVVVVVVRRVDRGRRSSIGHAWARATSVAPSSGATPRKSRIVRLIESRGENPSSRRALRAVGDAEVEQEVEEARRRADELRGPQHLR